MKAAMKRKWIWISCFMLVLLATVSGRADTSQGRVRILFFYSEERGGSAAREALLGPLSIKYPIEIQSYPLNELRNYDLLVGLENQLQQESTEFPAVVIGDKILGGEERIRRDLEGLVRSYAEKGGSPWPSLHVTKTERWIPEAPADKEKDSRKIIYGAFFYTPGCRDCEGKKAKLKEWASQFPDLRIGVFDLTEGENKKLDEALAMMYRVPESERSTRLALYIGEHYVSSNDFRYEIFQNIVSKYEGKGIPSTMGECCPGKFEKRTTEDVRAVQAIEPPGRVDGRLH